MNLLKRRKLNPNNQSRQRIVKILLLVLILLCFVFGAAQFVWYYFMTPAEKSQTHPGEKSNIVTHKWRYYLDTKTNLPRRIEKYHQTYKDKDFVLKETLVLAYPTDEEIETVINEHFPD